MLVFAVLVFCILGAIPAFADSMDTKTASVQIPVSCAGTRTKETFTYTLTGSLSEYETVIKGTLFLRAGETGSFSISYSYPGEYHLKAAQEAGKDPYTVYDDAIYDITVYVTEDRDGKMTAEAVVYIEGQADKKAFLSFSNTRNVPKTSSMGARSSGQNSKTTSAGSVKTGDLFHLAGWTAFAGISLLLYIFLILRKRSDINA